METMTIERTTGEEPLVFNGALLWQGRTVYGPRSDWAETRLFRTEEGRYVLALAHRVPYWEEERGRYDAWVFDTTEGALEALGREAPRAARVLARELE